MDGESAKRDARKRGPFKIKYNTDAKETLRKLQRLPHVRLLAVVNAMPEVTIPCNWIGDYPGCY